ncbi:MAG: threonine synthase [Peptostreptococcales bacterium]
MIDYKSTRGHDEIKNSAQAIIQGIAKDKGLFVPRSIPAIEGGIGSLVGRDYKDIAYEVLSRFLSDFSKEDILDAVQKAYDSKFEKDEIVPLIEKGGVHFLELYHGKTSAFKDMALSILPHLLTKSLKKEKENKKIIILTATSGDTGKAALEGFADVENTEIIVYYPVDGVSQVQRMQMITQEGKNTHVVAIKGNFDNAQTGVKNIFSDDVFNKGLNDKGYMLSSANSINIGRLVPQVAYYVYAYAQLIGAGKIKDGESINIVVPTGNFGNILAAYYASHMGVKVHKFICASNKNKVLTDFINTGIYDINRQFYVTNSPSMDILISSNLERLLYHLSDGKEEVIRELMLQLENEKKYEIPDDVKERMKIFAAGFADEQDTIEAIKDLYQRENYLMDTHTAVAYDVYSKYKENTKDDTITIIASTASPYKFSNSVIAALDEEASGTEFELVQQLEKITGIPIPKGLKDLDKKEVLHHRVIEKEDMLKELEKAYL